MALPEETQDTILELNPAHGGPAPHCSAGMGEGVGAVDGPQGAAAWETGSVTGAGASGRDLGDGDLGALRAQAPALGEVAGCRVSSPEAELGDGSFRPGGLATGRGGSAGGGGGGGGRWGGDGGGGGCCCCCCSGGGCCGRGGGGGSGGLSGHAVVSLEGCVGCEQACGISLACSGGVVCDWEAAPRGEWERKESREGQNLDPTWSAGKDAAFSGLGCLPFYPDLRCTHYLDENEALRRPRGVCELRAMSGAAPPRTGSSPGCAAADSPGSCDHRGAAPSRGCSAAGSSPLLRWRSSCSRCRPRYHCHCSRRYRSCRNDRNQTETATESSGGPWLGRAVVDGRDEGRLERWTFRNGQEPPSSDRFSASLYPPSYL